jgi:hypothetical protein
MLHDDLYDLEGNEKPEMDGGGNISAYHIWHRHLWHRYFGLALDRWVICAESR